MNAVVSFHHPTGERTSLALRLRYVLYERGAQRGRPDNGLLVCLAEQLKRNIPMGEDADILNAGAALYMSQQLQRR
jgi:hypothetical protein